MFRRLALLAPLSLAVACGGDGIDIGIDLGPLLDWFDKGEDDDEGANETHDPGWDDYDSDYGYGTYEPNEGYDYGYDVDSTYTAPVDTADWYWGTTEIDSLSVGCVDDVATFQAMTTGWTGDGEVILVPTAMVLAHVETHDLVSQAHGPANQWDDLVVRLEADGLWYTPGSETALPCEVFNGAGLTYVVSVNDPDGDFIDCVVWGDDPQGVLDGDYPMDGVDLPVDCEVW